MATIKTMLNNVLAQSGFLEKPAFFSASDPDDKQMTAIANRVADEILNYFTWPAMRTSGSITMTTATSYDLPVDFKELVPDSAWETDGSRKANWPVPDNTWYMYKYSALSSGITMQIKMYGDTIQTVDPVEGEVVSFDYISKYPTLTAGSVAQEKFTADTDTWKMDDQLLTLGIQAHWQQAKGMPSYQEHMMNYRLKLNEAIGRASAAQTISDKRGPLFGSPYYPLWRS